MKSHDMIACVMIHFVSETIVRQSSVARCKASPRCMCITVPFGKVLKVRAIMVVYSLRIRDENGMA